MFYNIHDLGSGDTVLTYVKLERSCDPDPPASAGVKYHAPRTRQAILRQTDVPIPIGLHVLSLPPQGCQL